MSEVAGEVKLLLTADGTSWSQALDKAQRDLNKLKGATTEASRVTRAEMTEARHAIHLVGDEIGIHVPRAVQGFLAKLPGVAQVMSSAFSAAAVVGLGMAIVEAGKKVYEFMEKQKKAAEEAERATKKLISGREEATLELVASNAKLDEQIAKLEKKPGDGLKTALAEARLEAFKFGEAIDRDIEEMHRLIETSQSAGWMQQAFLGAASSQSTLDQIAKFGDEMDKIALITDPAKRADQTKKFAGDTLKNLNTEFTERERLQDLENKRKTTGPLGSGEERERQGLVRKYQTDLLSGIDQTTALTALKTYWRSVQGIYNQAAATAENVEKTRTEKQLETQKEREDLAKAGLEALKRQTAERMTAMEGDLANQKSAHAMSIEEERSFWQKRYMTGANLADPINDMVARKMAPLSQEIFKKQQSDAKEFLRMMQELQTESDRAADKGNPFMPDREQTRNLGATDSARMAALHDRPEIMRRIAEAQEELTAREAVQAGVMEDHTAKILEKTNALRRLRAELAEIEGKRAAVAALGPTAYTPQMNPQVLQNQAIQKQAEIGAAEQSLQYEKERDTFGGEMSLMFSDWIKRTTDLRAVISSTFTESLSTINSAIVKTMVDPFHRGDWKAAGKSIFSSVAGSGLSMAEGSIAKAFHVSGLGKLGATQQNPMWTRDAGTAVGRAGGQVMSSLLGSAATGSTSPRSTVGTVLGSLVSLIPHLAGGGSLETGMPALVGEQGPELFVPSGSGRVVPNNAWGAGTTNYNIDARGATDPAATRFAVQRGILEAAPRIAAGSIAAARDISARKPTMSR